MLALSPPLFSTTYGWPLDDLITQNLQQDCNEDNSYHSLLDFPANIQIQHEFEQENSTSMSSKGAANGNLDDPMKVAKKLNHNASERDRRKRVNELYSFLHSLLPMSSDRTKKCLGEERLLNTLHFQVHGDHIVEAEKLKENLCSLYQQ
ncbi:hypothetical protein L1987_82261 [Smallanthus sonchifolius]|uniref:Uncharacterized protein n=1 Tax=Smallanthus sonchifolius TaxID=185202 RepID=A0ACB8YBC4_9ASTR|nr:hypothetical protein L1987_82261 [Smallanthus sonchifolius]